MAQVVPIDEKEAWKRCGSLVAPALTSGCCVMLCGASSSSIKFAVADVFVQPAQLRGFRLKTCLLEKSRTSRPAKRHVYRSRRQARLFRHKHNLRSSQRGPPSRHGHALWLGKLARTNDDSTSTRVREAKVASQLASHCVPRQPRARAQQARW